ncbi:hypothetical protein TomMM35A_18230 [Sphingobium sp. TomMM35A]
MNSYENLRPETADIFRQLDILNLRQRDLARALGLEENKVSKIKTGERQFKYPELLRAREWLQSQNADLLYQAGDGNGIVVEAKRTGQRTPAEEGQLESDVDEVEIQQWDVAYGMGGGTYLDLPVTGETHKFSRSWLRQFTHAPPNQIFLATGTGDSMMPTILDADIVIVDTSQREVRLADKIWAAAYGQTGIIKRLRPMPDGSVKILSDNPNVPPETAYDGELSVVGRVVAVVRKM